MLKKSIPVVIAGLIFITIAGAGIYQKAQYDKRIAFLATLRLENITGVTIYPRVSHPVGESFSFKNSHPLVKEFLQSLSDLRRYRTNNDRVISWDHSWFLEIYSGDISVQMSFIIPTEKGNLVAGHLGNFKENSVTPYGYFQSQQLYHWYQKYSHCWLTPEE